MASSSDPFKQEAVVRKQNNKAPFKFLVPLVYAPVLPLIRIALRKNPVVRDRVFTAVLAGAFCHGFYLVALHDFGRKREQFYVTKVFGLLTNLMALEGVELSIMDIKIGTLGAYFIGYLLSIMIFLQFRSDLYDSESK